MRLTQTHANGKAIRRMVLASGHALREKGSAGLQEAITRRMVR